MDGESHRSSGFSPEENICTNCATMYTTTLNRYCFDTTADTVYWMNPLVMVSLVELPLFYIDNSPCFRLVEFVRNGSDADSLDMHVR